MPTWSSKSRTKQNNGWSSCWSALFSLKGRLSHFATRLNLKRWNFCIDAKCDLCGDLSPTVLHILNGCPVALNQLRYTWKHDSVLKIIDAFVRPQLSTEEMLYTDLPGLKAQENPDCTIPFKLLVTTERPDMVYVCNNRVVLIELTIPLNSPESLNRVQSTKQTKQLYQQLLNDLDSMGKQATLVTIENGSLGHYLPSCSKVPYESITRIFEKSKTRDLFDSATRTAISASYTIFLARKNSH